MIKYVKQYGLQRSGTNAIKGLLEENFDVRVLNLILGSKHEPFDLAQAKQWKPDKDVLPKLGLADGEMARIRRALADEKLYATLIIKNPYSWIISLHTYRSRKAKQPLAFDEAYVRVNIGVWIEHNLSWLKSLPAHFEEKLLVCSFDDLISRPELLLRRFESAMGLKRRRNDLMMVLPNATKAATDGQHGAEVEGTKPFDRESYQRGAHREVLTESLRTAADEVLADAPAQLRGFIRW